ncbi:hypothetical protein [Megasphaera hominis]|jgi:hypothetical protein|uniref:Uncharacterized protein n=1 Tax=Megasphaera hominis TaxID=159836 RepID=A0ABR6VG20_9FIRM|nr:hypothetical protein [Megasphaera hominis]MBC3536146.1 hypothetical protein [Megasphaera hominis]
MDEMDNIAQYPIYFAPGCKMLQLEPVLTSQLYDYLHQLFGKIQLYTRCCVFDDARTHDEEAVFITICPTCFSIYGETYANLHMRDFGVLYDEYKDVYPLADYEAMQQRIRQVMAAPYPKEALNDWFEKFSK